jgi:hypothetical protein
MGQTYTLRLRGDLYRLAFFMQNRLAMAPVDSFDQFCKESRVPSVDRKRGKRLTFRELASAAAEEAVEPEAAVRRMLAEPVFLRSMEILLRRLVLPETVPPDKTEEDKIWAGFINGLMAKVFPAEKVIEAVAPEFGPLGIPFD